MVDTDLERALGTEAPPETTCEGLYQRWETQQWAVSALDFTRDQQDWAAMAEPLQKAFQRTMTLFFVGEQAVTDTLSPILHAAPREDERIFLATQVADEARHTVFFQRFFAEVLGIGGSLEETLAGLRGRTVGGFRKIFDEHLAGATDLVRREPRNERAWVEAIVTYHLVIEGFLALSGQRVYLRQLRTTGILPGFTDGFLNVARDESRHIGFGALALRRRVDADPAMRKVIVDKLLELLEPAVQTAVAPDRRLAFEDPSLVPAAFRVNPLESRDFAAAALGKRLRAAGLEPRQVAAVRDAMRGHYDAAWTLYERNHGVRHPVRWYQEEAVGGG
jgi:ribonucleoside-diphosphate reductase beta chain